MCQHVEKMKNNVLPKGSHRQHATNPQQINNTNGFTLIWEYFRLIGLLERLLDILLWWHFYSACNLYSTKIYFNTQKDSTKTGYLGHLYYCSEASLILSDTPNHSVICQEWCLHSENCGESVKAGGIWPELAPGLGAGREDLNLHCRLCPGSRAQFSFSSPQFQDQQGRKQGRKFLLINENFDKIILSNTSRICWTASKEFKATTQETSEQKQKGTKHLVYSHSGQTTITTTSSP